MDKNGLRSFGFHSEDQAALATALTPTLATITSLEGEADLSKASAETAARHYLQNAFASDDLPAFTMGSAEETTEFKSLGTEAVPVTNSQTVKFRQFHRDIPVYGSLVTIELDEKNNLLSLNSALGEPGAVDPVAQLSPAEALAVVAEAAGYAGNRLDAVPRIFYYFDSPEERWRLVYFIESVFEYLTENEEANPELAQGISDYIVDAHTGAIVARVPRMHSAAASFEDANDGLGIRRRFGYSTDTVTFRNVMSDPTLNVQTCDFEFKDVGLLNTSLPGGVVATPPPPWNPAGVSAHANASEVAAFMRDVLRRNGFDNQGSKLVSSINCVWRALGSVGTEWRNAAWIGTQMVYGQRNAGGSLRSYAVALDVVAHEVFHGVTQSSSDLQYLGMSGALNESYSDIFGILISNYQESDINKWSWQMGEHLSGTGVPMRDLSDPGKHSQPDHMNDYRQLPLNRAGDYGGVHINSGIHNKAAFLLMTSRDAQSRLLFNPGLLAALFYVALTQHLSRTSTFSDSYRAIGLVAKTILRNDPARDVKLSAIDKAFAAVGIS